MPEVFTLPDSSFSSSRFLDPKIQPLIIVVVLVAVCSSPYNNLVSCAPKGWCFGWYYDDIDNYKLPSELRSISEEFVVVVVSSAFVDRCIL